MAKAHEVTIGADARAFEQGIRDGVIKPLEKAEDAFDDLGDAANDAGREGSRGMDDLEDSLRDAQRQTERLERSTKDLGDGGSAAMDRIKGGASELRQEVGQNLGEAVSSFRGDLSDLGQVGQDTLGGLAATVAGAGPMGLVGALGLAAGAAGLGALTAGLEAAEQRRQVLADRAQDLAEAYIEAGTTVLDTMTRVDRFADVLSDPETRKEAQELAKLLGGDLALATRILAGDEDALAQARVHQKAAMDDQQIAGLALKQSLDDQADVLRMAKENATLVSDEYKRMANDAGEATREVDALGNELYTLPDGKQIVVDAETGIASENIEAFKGDVDGIKDKVVNVRVRRDTSEWDNWTPNEKVAYVQTRVTGSSPLTRQILGG